MTPPDVLTRAAALLDDAQPGHVIPALLECADPDVRRTAVHAVDVEGGNPTKAASALRRAAAGTGLAVRAAQPCS